MASSGVRRAVAVSVEWLCHPLAKLAEDVATSPVLIAFDLLYVRGRDLGQRPRRERRARHEDLVTGAELVPRRRSLSTLRCLPLVCHATRWSHAAVLRGTRRVWRTPCGSRASADVSSRSAPRPPARPKSWPNWRAFRSRRSSSRSCSSFETCGSKRRNCRQRRRLRPRGCPRAVSSRSRKLGVPWDNGADPAGAERRLALENLHEGARPREVGH